MHQGFHQGRSSKQTVVSCCPEPICPVVCTCSHVQQKQWRVQRLKCSATRAPSREKYKVKYVELPSRTNMPWFCKRRHVQQKQWQEQRLKCSVTRDPWAARTCTWRTSLSLTADKSSLRCVVTTNYTCIRLADTFWHVEFPAGVDIGLSCVFETGIHALWHSGDDSKPIQEQKCKIMYSKKDMTQQNIGPTSACAPHPSRSLKLVCC